MPRPAVMTRPERPRCAAAASRSERRSRVDSMALGGSARGLVAGDAGDPCPGQDGADVGERVTPGVVVDGSDEDEVGVGCTRGIGTGRDQSGRGSVRAGGLQREAGRSGPPVVGDRDADAAGARVEGGVECLARLGPSREAFATEGVREQLGHDHGGVLRGAAAGDDDGLAGGGRLEDGVAQPRHLGTVGAEDRRRELRLREDHLLHHPRRRIAQLGEVVGQPVAVVAGHRAPPDRGSLPGVIVFAAGGVITIMRTCRGRVPLLP